MSFPAPSPWHVKAQSRTAHTGLTPEQHTNSLCHLQNVYLESQNGCHVSIYQCGRRSNPDAARLFISTPIRSKCTGRLLPFVGYAEVKKLCNNLPNLLII